MRRELGRQTSLRGNGGIDRVRREGRAGNVFTRKSRREHDQEKSVKSNQFMAAAEETYAKAARDVPPQGGSWPREKLGVNSETQSFRP
jgi:hypothetical protein